MSAGRRDERSAVAATSTGAAAASAPAVALHGVTADLGARRVLRGIDLTVGRGEVVALLGANGSGKSTTLRAVIGQIPPAGGRIEIFGVPQRRFRDWARLGYVPQRAAETSGVPATVLEVVSSGRLSRARFGMLRRADRAAVRRAIELVDLADRAKDPVGALSGGQYQRVLIARALASEPELLIMDEPMAGVDLAVQRDLAATLRRLVADGTSVLLVLHELGPLAPLIDRSVLLRDGRVAHETLHARDMEPPASEAVPASPASPASPTASPAAATAAVAAAHPIPDRP